MVARMNSLLTTAQGTGENNSNALQHCSIQCNSPATNTLSLGFIMLTVSSIFFFETVVCDFRFLSNDCVFVTAVWLFLISDVVPPCGCIKNNTWMDTFESNT